MGNPRVFISSTCKDLSVHRERIVERLKSLGLAPICSEDFAFPVNPKLNAIDNCYSTVEDSADILILIIGNRYGSIDNNGKSVTENEYCRAIKLGIPVITLVDQKTMDYIPIYRQNPDLNLEGMIDNPALFDFIDRIVTKDKQWVFKFKALSEIEQVIVSQLAFLFSLSLACFQKVNRLSNLEILDLIRPGSRKILLEQGALWEFDLISSLLADNYKELRYKEVACKFGYAEKPLKRVEEIDDLAELKTIFDSERILLVAKNVTILVNKILTESIGAPGVPGNPELIIFATKEIANNYRIFLDEYIEISKYSDNVLIGELAKRYLQIIEPMKDFLHGFPNEWDDRVIEIRKAIEEKETKITLEFVLPSGDTAPFIEEMGRLTNVYLQAQEPKCF